MGSLLGSAMTGSLPRAFAPASGGRHGTTGVAVLALFAALPLQWFGLFSTPLGFTRLHQVALLTFAAAVLIRYGLETHSSLLLTTKPFVMASIYLLSVWAAVDLYNSNVPIGSVQTALYLCAFIAFAIYFYRVACGKQGRTVERLRWAAPTACASLLIGFSVAMLRNGVDPLVIIQTTIATADPELLQRQVFKTSFNGFGLDEEAVRGNLRHEIFGSLLLSMCVSTWAMQFGSAVTPLQRFFYRMSMAAGTALLLMSMSRSVLIAAALWPAMAFFRMARAGRLSTSQVVAAYLCLTCFAGLVFSGFGLVIWNRFTEDTASYDARVDNYATAFTFLRDHWLTGGYETSGVGASSHNLVVDSWLRGGVFTAIPAAFIVIILVVMLIRLVTHLHRLPVWVTPVAAALVLPIIRLGTVGGGQIPPIEWLALGFTFAMVAHLRLVHKEASHVFRVTPRDA